MTALRYVEGVGLLALLVLPLLLIARAVHRTFLANVTGAPGVLAEIVVGVSLFVTSSQLVGALGLFSVATLVVLYWLIVAAVGLRAGWAVFTRPRAQAGPCAGSARLLRLVCAAALVVVATDWIARTWSTVDHGFLDVDTFWYHLPFAARFAQNGSLWHIPYVSADPLLPGVNFAVLGATSGVVNFYPENASIFHAAGLLVFGRDVLSPLLNLGWLMLFVFACFCVGADRRAGWTAAAGGLLIGALPIVVSTQSVTAKDDLLGLALFTAAAALCLCAPREPRVLAVAGLASGVAFGTKLSFAPPVLALAVTTTVLGPVRKASAALMWTAGILATGAFWFFRNALQTGSPLPLLHLGALGLPGASVPSVDASNQSVAHYLFDGRLWSHTFVPGIHRALGTLWMVVAAIALAGIVLALVRGRRLERALGLTAAISAIAYLFIPQSAGGPEGHPYLFGGALRYLTPALALGVLLAALETTRLTAGRLIRLGIAASLGAAAIVSIVVSGESTRHYAARGALIACVVALPLVVSRCARQIALVLVACAVVGGWPVADRWVARRYNVGPPFQPLQPIYAWGQTIRHSRIAIAGFQEAYPLYGPDGSNRVDYLGVHESRGTFRPPATCREWLRVLRRGRYDYLVLTTYLFPFAPRVPSPTFRWTPYPRTALRYTKRAPGTAIFRLNRRSGAGGCGAIRLSSGPRTGRRNERGATSRAAERARGS